MKIDTEQHADQPRFNKLLELWGLATDLENYDPSPLTYGIIGEIIDGTEDAPDDVENSTRVIDAMIADLYAMRSAVVCASHVDHDCPSVRCHDCGRCAMHIDDEAGD